MSATLPFIATSVEERNIVCKLVPWFETSKPLSLGRFKWGLPERGVFAFASQYMDPRKARGKKTPKSQRHSQDQLFQRPRKRGGGGAKKRGGQNQTRRPPTQNSFRPPHLGTFCPLPHSISLSKSLRNSQNFPQLTSSETAFGGSRKSGFRRAILARFCFSVRSPPPLAMSQEIALRLLDVSEFRALFVRPGVAVLLWQAAGGKHEEVCSRVLCLSRLGKQKVGYGMVVDGFAKFQALNFGISGPEISEGLSF